MGLKELVNKGKCLIGLHEGEWRAASPTVCTYTRTCVRCAAKHSKVEHPWGDWRFVAEQSCEQLRSCSRCSMHEQRILHAHGDATFVSASSCEMQEVCRRCHDRRPVAARHSMTEWRFVDAEECRQVQHCSRCDVAGAQTRTLHTWGEWQHSNAHNGGVSACKRCGELQVRSATAPVGPEAPAAGESPDVKRSDSAQRHVLLVAHWRHTEIMSSGGFSLVTDTHLVLQADGRFRRWTHSASSMGSQTSEALTGSWHTEGDRLHSRTDGSGAGSAIRFTLQGDKLFFPDGGTQKLWERVR